MAWTIRNSGPGYSGDLQAIADLNNACAAAAGSSRRVSAEEMRAALDLPGQDPSSERWLALDASGEVIGFGWLWAQTTERCAISIAIHPEFRRQGLGTALLAHCTRRARQKGASHLAARVSETNEAGRSFLLRSGFEKAGDDRVLAFPEGRPLPAAPWPAGFSACTYAETRDLKALVALMNRCYHDLWGHSENDPGAVNEATVAGWMEAYPQSFLPEGIFIALSPGGEAVGMSKAMLDGDRLVIDCPGVVPTFRAAGLHAALALAAMRFLRARGSGPISLESWGDAEDTIRVYQALGFELQEHHLEFKCLL